MSIVSFQDGEGAKRYINVTGEGSTNDPFIFLFKLPDNVTLPIAFDKNVPLKICDGNNQNRTLTIDENGVVTVKILDEPVASNPNAPSGLIGLIRGLWVSVLQLVQAIGTQNDASNSTGSLLARLRSLIVDTIGFVSDIASATDSLMARIRLIANAYGFTNRYSKYGTTSGETISTSSARLLSICVWNKSSQIRYLQLFDRNISATNGTFPTETYVISPYERLILNPIDFGSHGGSEFTTGLTWGFSTTEATYTAAPVTDVSIIIRWRNFVMSTSAIISQLISEQLVLVNGFTIANSNPLTIYRKGDIGFLVGQITRNTIPTPGTTIANVNNPTLRPIRHLSIPVIDGGTGTYIARFDLYPNGDLLYVGGNSFPFYSNGVLMAFV